jgi:ABC-type Mn2+/Zn2+ transport system ATPase subunit
MSIIPKTIEITLKSPVNKNFRCQVAANSLDIDVEKKSIHHLKIENAALPEKWNIGIVYGSSGSGKTTLMKQIFGEDCFDFKLNPDEPVINQFNNDIPYEECASILTGIGLSSVPCWIRPVKTLSNGQHARAHSALAMTSTADIVCIDEWTSVVDRTVAKAMSHCLQKYAKRNNKRIILCSCHYDILEWLNPDWLIDCNKQKFIPRAQEAFFFEPREKLKFDIRTVERDTWRYFSKYHYLSSNLPGGKLYLFGLFHGDDQVGFHCYANYCCQHRGQKKVLHSNRLVIHPDYCGLGLGLKFINLTAQYMLNTYKNIAIFSKFSAIPTHKARKNCKEWIFLGSRRLMKAHDKTGKRMDRQTGFREKGVRTFHYKFIGSQNSVEPI